MQGEKKKWFDEESDDEDASGDESGSDASTDEEEVRPPTTSMTIQDQTETNLVNLRRTIYLTIMSSMDFEEAGHKLMKIELGPGQEMEIVTMLIECCSQEKTYLRCFLLSLNSGPTFQQPVQLYCHIASAGKGNNRKDLACIRIFNVPTLGNIVHVYLMASVE